MSTRRVTQDRFVCDLEVELDSGRARVVGRARDMNEAAVVLVAREAIQPGQSVQVQLRLVLEWGTSEALLLPGQVAWSTVTEGMQQSGVVFTAMAPEVRQRLLVLLRALNGQISLPTRSS